MKTVLAFHNHFGLHYRAVSGNDEGVIAEAVYQYVRDTHEFLTDTNHFGYVQSSGRMTIYKGDMDAVVPWFCQLWQVEHEQDLVGLYKEVGAQSRKYDSQAALHTDTVRGRSYARNNRRLAEDCRRRQGLLKLRLEAFRDLQSGKVDRDDAVYYSERQI